MTGPAPDKRRLRLRSSAVETASCHTQRQPPELGRVRDTIPIPVGNNVRLPAGTYVVDLTQGWREQHGTCAGCAFQHSHQERTGV